MKEPALISVIITTYRRPKLVLRAVTGALQQTLTNFEVIVVVDGPDPEVEAVLSTVQDSRFRFVILPQNVRLAGARNAGVKEAKGDWVAFLDDDDEWMPNKLELQLNAAFNSQYACPIVVSRFINKTEVGESVWPRRLPYNAEPLGDYLFVRHSLFQGEGAFLPSTYFTKKELLIKFPFENNKHEDYDWLLRASASSQDVGIDYVDEPLAIWHSHIGLGEKRLSQIPDWRYSLDWVQSARELMTPRAYSSFLMTNVASPAAEQRDWPAFGILLKEAVQKGNPRLLDFLLYLSMWLMSGEQREKIRATFTKRKSTKSEIIT
jgi:glycosyltransferase involved in cell wall biosynthesis